MKLVVNVISLFFSDKSVLIDGYQGNANPIFISILLIMYYIYIYIFRILVFRKSLLKDVVFLWLWVVQPEVGELLENFGNEYKTRSFKVSYYVVGLLAISYTILWTISLLYASLYFIFPCYCIHFRMNISWCKIYLWSTFEIIGRTSEMKEESSY